MLSYEARHSNPLRLFARRSGGVTRQSMFNLFLNYSTVATAVNTTTETSLLGAPDLGTSKTVTPALASVGRTFELSFFGVFGWTAAPALTVRLKLGGAAGTLLQIYTPLLVGANAGTAWRLNLYVTITASGVGGIVQANPGLLLFSAPGPDAPAQLSGRNANAPAVDLSVAKDWALTAQWGVADALNFFTYNFGCINVV